MVNRCPSRYRSCSAIPLLSSNRSGGRVLISYVYVKRNLTATDFLCGALAMSQQHANAPLPERARRPIGLLSGSRKATRTLSRRCFQCFEN
jgi:hypothetical protein